MARCRRPTSFAKPAESERQRDSNSRKIYPADPGLIAAFAAATSPELANDPTLQNDMAYLNLLLGLPEDTKKAAFQCEANPRDFAFRTTYALALLKAGKNKEALAMLDKCQPDIHVASLPPHQKAIVAAALAANGRRNEALGTASILPPQQLSVQEIEFVRSYLAQLEPTLAPATQKKKHRRKSECGGAGVLSFKFVSFKRWGAELARNAASRIESRVGTARRRRPTPAPQAPLNQRSGAGAPEVGDTDGAASLPIFTKVLPNPAQLET